MNEAGPHTFTLRMASFPQISWHYMTCQSAVRFLLQGGLCSSPWWIGTKEEFHGWYHLVKTWSSKLKANMSIVDTSVFSKLALSQISVLYLQTLVTHSLFYDSVQIFGTYTLFFLLGSHPILFSSSLSTAWVTTIIVLPLNYVSSLEFIFFLIKLHGELSG